MILVVLLGPILHIILYKQVLFNVLECGCIPTASEFQDLPRRLLLLSDLLSRSNITGSEALDVTIVAEVKRGFHGSGCLLRHKLRMRSVRCRQTC